MRASARQAVPLQWGSGMPAVAVLAPVAVARSAPAVAMAHHRKVSVRQSANCRLSGVARPAGTAAEQRLATVLCYVCIEDYKMTVDLATQVAS